MLTFRDKLLYGILLLAIVILAAALIYPYFWAETEVNIYFGSSEAQYLAPETRQLRNRELPEQAVEELIAGPTSENLSVTIPEGTELLNLEVEAGQAVVNFNQQIVDNHWGGSTGELMTVYSIVNTLTRLEDIDQVQIKVEGEEVETLAGHLDLTRPLGFNSELVE